MTLIDLVRDGYGALAGKDRAGADNLLRQWLLSTEPLFARLALHALTENPKSDISLARKLLIAGRQPGLWRNELRREVLRFLRQAGARLPRPLRVALVRAIHAGPKQRAGEPWTSDAATVRRETGLRLHKLAESGARIDKRSQALADEAGEAMREMEEDREEFIVWTGGGWIGPEELTPGRPARRGCGRHRGRNQRRDDRRGGISESRSGTASEGGGCSGAGGRRREVARSALARAAVVHPSCTRAARRHHETAREHRRHADDCTRGTVRGDRYADHLDRRGASEGVGDRARRRLRGILDAGLGGRQDKQAGEDRRHRRPDDGRGEPSRGEAGGSGARAALEVQAGGRKEAAGEGEAVLRRDGRLRSRTLCPRDARSKAALPARNRPPNGSRRSSSRT